MQGQSLDQSEILSIRWAHDDPNPVAQDAISRADKDALSLLLTAKGVSVTPANFEYPADYILPPPPSTTAVPAVPTTTSSGGSGGGGVTLDSTATTDGGSYQPEAKRIRFEDGTDVATERPDLIYPNTDNQYSTTNEAAYQQYFNNMTEAQYKAYCEAYYAQQAILNVNNIITTNTTQEAQEKQDNNDEDDKLNSFLSELNNAPTTTTTTAATTTAADVAVSNLPAGWSEYTDDDTGATYYYNAITEQSSWEVPSE